MPNIEPACLPTAGRQGCQVTPLPTIDGERRTYWGISQPFVAHSHSRYVLGCVLEGKRKLELLKLGASANEVALQLGFADQAHLTRAFKQRTGTAPAAYRRMAQGETGPAA